jgi:oligopeptide/dipeptide ABC transporter ATP-binding protein
MKNSELLTIKSLKTHFYSDIGIAEAVDGINLVVNRGETLGLVGESGSGKTVTALSIMRLVARPGKIVEGEVIFNNEDLLKKSEDEMRKIRGAEISMVFQDPTTYLNPVLTIGEQVEESIRLHQGVNKSEARRRAIEMLENVGITDASERCRDYPHQFSGGMRQRVMIAIALSCHPALLIADEPTTNLDVTIQLQILELMKDLQKKTGTSILLITHDLGVVAHMADKVAVMYAGRIMEYGDVETVFEDPKNPYSKALLGSALRVDVARKRLEAIPGMIPPLIDPPTGCRFHPRCKYAKEICRKKRPPLVEIAPSHFVSCLRVAEMAFQSEDNKQN